MLSLICALSIQKMSDRMPKADLAKLKQTELHFVKQVEQKNFERAQKLTRLRRNNLITGCLLGVGVLSIYGYSMYAVRQESFLDDFDEPAKTTQ
ncbi:hypothetical protein NQ314_016505 [Rhamnusium bicolor]|uniref:Cytochrome c oxidase assembly factor 3 n=1 Tax=Rhamnusium bicolor TaxID=1586634 RepID=A0AAV8WW39_9CUCU|nr:hypothetical protein NQ314_016505 [Rhamnusium bicolor]